MSQLTKAYVIKKRKFLKPTDQQERRIKMLIKSGCSAKLIAEETSLSIEVVKRYFKSKYFSLKNQKICIKCGKRPPTKGNKMCSFCKQGKSIDDLDFYPTEASISEIVECEYSKYDKNDRNNKGE